MLRFISQNLSEMDGVSIFPILSLLIFTTFFAVVVTYVIKMRKSHVDEVSSIPLEDNEDQDIFTESFNA